MKKVFLKTALSVRQFLLYSFICLLTVSSFNSCKKDQRIYSGEKPASGQNPVGPYSSKDVLNVTFQSFLDSTKNISSGSLVKVLSSAASNGELKVNDQGTTNSITIVIDSIKLMYNAGHSTYTFPVKQAKIYDHKFRNFIVDIYNGVATSFLITYTPDATYLHNYSHRIKGPFSGNVHLELFDPAIGGLQITSQNLREHLAQICTTILVYNGSYAVTCNCDEKHMPGDARCICDQCPDYYGYKGYWQDTYAPVTICENIDLPPTGGGNGGGGGGGGTPPTPPPNYDPCPPAAVQSTGLKVQYAEGEPPCLTPPPPQIDPNDPQFDPPMPNLLDTNGLYKYPAFKQLVTNLPSFLQQYPNVLQALSYYSGFSQAKILRLMKPNAGPKIKVVHDLRNSSGASIEAHYDDGPKVLEINEDLILQFNSTSSSKRARAMALMIAITTLHEFVHYGRDANHLTDLFVDPVTGAASEAGWTFEANIAPNRSISGITRGNSVIWVNFYRYNF